MLYGRSQRTQDEIDEVFRALADPIRREILGIVTDEMGVMEVVARMRGKASQTAVSRHLAVLRQAGLVEEEPGFDVHKQLKLQLASKHRIEEAFASLLRMWDR